MVGYISAAIGRGPSHGAFERIGQAEPQQNAYVERFIGRCATQMAVSVPWTDGEVGCTPTMDVDVPTMNA